MGKRQRQRERASALNESDIARFAIILAMTVRNAMEDFHCEHLSDKQMAELNPIIRNAIYTGLYALTRTSDSVADRFVAFQTMLVPSYWEAPELLPEYTEILPKDY